MIPDDRNVRFPVAAGSFYGDDPAALRRQLAALAPAPETERESLHGCMIPHAGYIFSLGTAMRTLGCAARPERIVLLGPSHRFAFEGAAVADFDFWRTPLGDVPVDREGLELIRGGGFSRLAIDDARHAGEHSLEVELPPIQFLWEGVPVLPAVVGQLDAAAADELGRELAVLDRPGTLWVVSGDFTHYGRNFGYTPLGDPVEPSRLRALDSEAAQLLAREDFSGFAAFLARTGATICGVNPAAAFLKMREHAGRRNRTGRVVEVTDSGAVSGDYRHVVGYAGIVWS